MIGFAHPAAARNSAWHQLQRRLAQDLHFFRSAEPRVARAHFGVRADKVCWLVRAHSNEPRPQASSARYPQQAA